MLTLRKSGTQRLREGTHRPRESETMRPWAPQTQGRGDLDTQEPRDPKTQRPRNLGVRDPETQRPSCYLYQYHQFHEAIAESGRSLLTTWEGQAPRVPKSTHAGAHVSTNAHLFIPYSPFKFPPPVSPFVGYYRGYSLSQAPNFPT